MNRELRKFTTEELMNEILYRFKDQEMCNKNLMTQIKIFLAANKRQNNGNCNSENK